MSTTTTTMEVDNTGTSKECSFLAIFNIALFLLVSVMLALSTWVQEDRKENPIPDKAFYTWMLAVLTLSELAMAVLCVLRRNRSYFEKVNSDDEWKGTNQKVCYVALAVFCVASITHQGNLVSMVREEKRHVGIDYAVIISAGCYCLFQLVFLLYTNNFKCKDGIPKLFLSLVISGNACLCVYFTLNLFNASPLFICDPQKTKSDNKTAAIDDELNRYVPGLNLENRSCTERERAIFNFVYPCPIEFCILSFYLLLQLWTNESVISTETTRNTTSASTASIGTQNSTDMVSSVLDSIVTRNRGHKLKLAIINSLKFICKNALYISIPIGLTNFIFRTYMFFNYLYKEMIKCENMTSKANDTLDTAETVGYYEQTIFAYLETLLAFGGYLLVRKIRIRNFRYTSEDLLLLFCALGTLIFTIFLTIDTSSKLSPDMEAVRILYFIKIILSFMWLYCQSTVVIKCSKPECLQALIVDQLDLSYAVFAFLFVSNVEKFLKNNIFTKSTLLFAFHSHISTYDNKNWFILTTFFNAFDCLYRFVTALKCYRIFRDMKKQFVPFTRFPSYQEESSNRDHTEVHESTVEENGH